VGAALLLAGAPGNGVAQEEAPPQGESATIRGTVVDLSCRFRHGHSGPDHRMCAQICADRGIPLVILTDDGHLYLPVSDEMPGVPQNDLLKDFAEEEVIVEGTIYEAGETHAIVIEAVRRS
jgi:hypothetical protein